MGKFKERNFAGRLVKRLGENSHLTDAATGQTLQGRAVADSIVGFAAGFLSAGFEAGDRVLIGCGLNPAGALAYLGAMYGGLVPVPVAERALTTRREQLFAKAQAKAVWVAEGACCDWTKSNGVPQLKGNSVARPAHSLQPAPCAEDDLAALMLTSGSTGMPQLVKVSHGNLVANTEAIVRSQNLGRDETAMLILPTSYCFGASIMQTHLYQGGGVVFDSRFMFPDKVLHAINQYGCTTFAGVPSVYNILLRRSNLRSIPLPGLRRFLQAGGALAPERVEEMREIAPQAQFYVMYGQTEATSRISCLPPDRLGEKLGSVGLPVDNLLLRIVDDEGRELPDGCTGEIQVKGPSVCSGYFGDAEATQRKFRDGWLKTGDFGCRDDGGYLWIKGRTSEFIKIRGLRVGFAEVEAKIATVPGIYECAAMAVEHSEAGEALALFVVADGGVNGIAERVRRALPPEWTCASVNVVTNLPKTANGKIARFELQATS
ncbi:MAG TPA: AMP-binding protein [Candidatus Acidoferrales bacterium]|nr:AMP-binding protein [Candidatus Acidoferrales bacterium]